jgi:hypothetical protein
LSLCSCLALCWPTMDLARLRDNTGHYLHIRHPLFMSQVPDPLHQTSRIYLQGSVLHSSEFHPLANPCFFCPTQLLPLTARVRLIAQPTPCEGIFQVILRRRQRKQVEPKSCVLVLWRSTLTWTAKHLNHPTPSRHDGKGDFPLSVLPEKRNISVGRHVLTYVLVSSFASISQSKRKTYWKMKDTVSALR